MLSGSLGQDNPGRVPIYGGNGQLAAARQLGRVAPFTSDHEAWQELFAAAEEACTAGRRGPAALDALLLLPEIGSPVGCAGGGIAIGTRLAVVEPQISAAFLFAGSFRPASCSRRAGRSPFRCRSCCSETTKETTGRWPWTYWTPSAPRRKRYPPI